MKKLVFSIILAAFFSAFTFAQTQPTHSGTSQSGTSVQSQSGQYGQSQSTQAGQSGRSSEQLDKQNGWVKIGEKTVDLDQDRGIFDWNTDREKTINANDKYSAIKFKSKDADVNLTSVEIQYSDGKKQDLNVSGPIKVGSDSKPVTLNSSEKLDKVTFSYQKGASSTDDKAKVELWGLKAKSNSGMGQSSDSTLIQK
jgi:lipopolysaccharide export LptBFGC system permease protein LptF